MRKNSKEIYEEILLEKELEKFPDRVRLKQCIDDLLNFKVNELDALLEAVELVKDNPILKKYVSTKIVEHSRNLIQVLGVTIEGWKVQIEELEEQRKCYGEIRDSIGKQIFSKPKEVS